MAIQKPSIPKGTRDFSPEEMVRRNYIFDTIRSVFKKYGYQQIETPAMENKETLMGKYGEEGDKLVYQIRSNKNLLTRYPQLKERIKDIYDYDWIPMASDKALRYDLTVPFARYVVQHQNEITFPFKRYQIQPVWRADNPQKGRYREFFQCDADVIGSNSLINEVELVQMIDEVFTGLNIPVKIKINNRKILAGIAEVMCAPDRMIDIAMAIDKASKIGWEGVKQELLEKGFTQLQFDTFIELIHGMSNHAEAYIDVYGEGNKSQIELDFLKTKYPSFQLIQDGIKELKFVFETIGTLKLQTAELEFFVILARGLDYYTGAIFEVEVDLHKSKSTFSSSITGGGRYDDLTGVFGLKNLSGVGISFGIDRIFDVLNEVGYPEDLNATAGTRLLFINKGGKSETLSLGLLKKIREHNIAAEIYPDNVKWEKQAKYVDAKKIPFTATVEEDGKITLKYKTGEKWNTETVSLDDLLNKIK